MMISMTLTNDLHVRYDVKILTCAQKLAVASLVYHMGPKTEN